MKLKILNRKIKILKISLIFLLLFFVGCNGDDYDWKSVEPAKLKIMLVESDSNDIEVDTIMGNNFQTRTYMVIPRGGSTYHWQCSSDEVTISPVIGRPYMVNVKANSSSDTYTWLTVEETTWGGKKSLPDSLKIIVIGYCLFEPSQLLRNGTFQSKMTSYAPYSTYLSYMGNDTIINHNFFNMRWALKYIIDKGYDQKITIVPNQIFVYNGEFVTVKGEGNYNTCNSLLVMNFAVCYLYGDTLEYGSGIDSLMFMP